MSLNPHLNNLPDTADPMLDTIDIDSAWELTTDGIQPHPAGERQPVFYGKRRVPRRIWIFILKPRWQISVMRRVIGLAKRLVFHTGAGLGDPDEILDSWEPWTYMLEMDLSDFGKVYTERPDEINLPYYFIEDAAYSLYDWEQHGNEERLMEYKRDLFFIAAIIALQMQYSLRLIAPEAYEASGGPAWELYTFGGKLLKVAREKYRSYRNQPKAQDFLAIQCPKVPGEVRSTFRVEDVVIKAIVDGKYPQGDVSTSANNVEDKNWKELFPLKPNGPTVKGRLRDVKYAIKTSDHGAPGDFTITNGPEEQKWGCTGPIYPRDEMADDEEDIHRRWGR